MNHYYRELPLFEGSLIDLLKRPELFEPVPKNWAVVMVDVKGSTEAVKLGFHHEVNLAATGAIVAVLNHIRSIDDTLKIAYFFGGDGATFLLPEELVGDLLDTLDQYKHHISNRVALTLKVGAHSIRGLYALGHQVKLARYAVNSLLTLPVILGTGVKYAERVIKDAQEGDEDEEQFSAETLDLDGMECRWDEIAPPRDAEQVLCLVAYCDDSAKQGELYAEVLQIIEQQFGDYIRRQPISGARLKLDLALSKIRKEMNFKLENYSLYALIRTWFFTLFGPYYLRYTNDGKAYLDSLTQLTHTLMIDGTLNCVFTGHADEVANFRKALDALEQRGNFRYGLHVTRASVMSCYVIDHERDHAHFVDGTDGGFTVAAAEFKGKV